MIRTATAKSRTKRSTTTKRTKNETVTQGGPGEITIGGKRLRVSNLDKVLYPKAGFTKGAVIDYYVRIAPVLLPHLKNRAITLKRYPNGVEAEFFYEKRCPSHRPDWVHTAEVWSERNQEPIHFCVINDLPTLVWAASVFCGAETCRATIALRLPT